MFCARSLFHVRLGDLNGIGPINAANFTSMRYPYTGEALRIKEILHGSYTAT